MKHIKLLLGTISITCGLAVCGYSQTFLTNGLVAYYPLNGNANDASGNGNNGTLVGTDLKFSLDRFGQPQSSLFLNTTSTPDPKLNGAYVAVPRSASLDFNQDFTLSVWVNLSSGNGTTNLPENLISNGRDDMSANLRIQANAIYFGGNDYLQFVCGPNGTQNIFALSPPVRQTWWQFTAVHSGSTLSLFRNGSLLTNGVIATVVNNPTIWLGRFQEVPYGDGSCYPLVGGIDDVRMYNRALSASEVQQLYVYESGPQVNLIKAVKPSFSNLILTTNYQLQVSADLSTWTNQGSVFTATNTSMVYPQYWDVDNWGQLFFRLQVAP
jgi:hypothetical protein